MFPKKKNEDIRGLAFSPDGRRLTWATNMRVEVRDLVNGNAQTIDLNDKYYGSGVKTVAFSPDGKRLASAGTTTSNQTVSVWDLGNVRELFSMQSHTRYVTSLAFSPDGKRLANTGRDQTVKLWDLANGQETLTLQRAGNVVVFSPDGQRLASASGKTVKIWNATPLSERIRREAVDFKD